MAGRTDADSESIFRHLPKKRHSPGIDLEKTLISPAGNWVWARSRSVRDLLLVYVHGGKTMQPKAIKTTLGDLIVAVTDEAKPFVDPSNLYAVVSCVLEDLATHRHLRFYSRPRQKNFIRYFD
jgi:hypothetical protein